jgi:hypothetical protein
MVLWGFNLNEFPDPKPPSGGVLDPMVGLPDLPAAPGVAEVGAHGNGRDHAEP